MLRNRVDMPHQTYLYYVGELLDDKESLLILNVATIARYHRNHLIIPNKKLRVKIGYEKGYSL